MILAAISLVYLNTAFGEEFEYFDEGAEGWGESFDEWEESDHVGGGEVDIAEEVSGVVDMEAKALDGDILKISVVSIDMKKPVLGMAFHLNYDPGKVRFLKYEPGDFLEQGGDPFYLVQNDEKKKEIIFGETLRRDDKFPVDGGKIVDFYFQVSKKQAMNFNFKQGAVSTMDTVRQDIDRIEWRDLRLDKNGRKIVDMTAENDVDMAKSVESSVVNLPENFWLMVAMGVVICGLLAYVFINRKKRKKYSNVLSI